MHASAIRLGFLAAVIAAPAAVSQLALQNGADIDMSGSTGSQIIFPDGTTIGSKDEVTIPPGHGGIGNDVGGENAFIGGGANNATVQRGAAIGGGGRNYAVQYASVAGGYFNTNIGSYGAVGGGNGNRVTDVNGTIAGGFANQAGNDTGNTGDAPFATVGGGKFNVSRGTASTVSGGFNNDASGNFSTIGGGRSNASAGSRSAVAGGSNNRANGYAAIAAGGVNNEANGDFSFAAGRLAVASHDNSFVWADGEGGSSNGAGTFNVYADGGIFLNGAVVHSSDRNLKTDFEGVDRIAILGKVLDLPVLQWRFKWEPEVTGHVGPTAQDFKAAFGLGGPDDRYIGAADADGVALAAIQGLNAKLEHELAEKDAAIETMRAELAALRNEIADLAALR